MCPDREDSSVLQEFRKRGERAGRDGRCAKPLNVALGNNTSLDSWNLALPSGAGINECHKHFEVTAHEAPAR